MNGQLCCNTAVNHWMIKGHDFSSCGNDHTAILNSKQVEDFTVWMVTRCIQRFSEEVDISQAMVDFHVGLWVSLPPSS